jgi:hypothetical protein
MKKALLWIAGILAVVVIITANACSSQTTSTPSAPSGQQSSQASQAARTEEPKADLEVVETHPEKGQFGERYIAVRLSI